MRKQLSSDISEIAVIVGLSAVTMAAIYSSDVIRNKNLKKVSNIRRNLDSDIEYKARGEKLHYINIVEIKTKSEIIEIVKKTYEVKKGKGLLEEYIKRNKKVIRFEEKLRLKEALMQIDDSINVYYAEKFRLELFLNEIDYSRKLLINTPIFEKRHSEIKNLDIKDFRISNNFPIKNRIVFCKVYKIESKIKFFLEYGIECKLSHLEESNLNLNSFNKYIEVLIESINYKKKFALISIQKVEIIQKIEKDSSSLFSATVMYVKEAGCTLLIGSVKCFLPKSYEFKGTRPKKGDEIFVVFAGNSYKYNSFIVKQSVKRNIILFK